MSSLKFPWLPMRYVAPFCLASLHVFLCIFWAFPVAQLEKNLPAMRETWVWSLCTFYLSFFLFIVLMCVLVCTGERTSEREREGRRERMDGEWLCECGQRKEARLDCILLARGTEEALVFSLSLSILFPSGPPELFINTGVLAEKDLPTSKGGKGEQETQCWPGNRSSAHRKSAQMRFFSVSHPPVFFFHPGENKLACEWKTGEPTRSKAAVLGHE